MQQKLILLVIFLIFIVLPTSVSAHVLKTDGTIGAVIHIDPEDNPIIGQSSNFFFELKDTTNQFTPQQCNCQVTILENNQAIHIETLFQDQVNPSLNHASFAYTFPRKNVYQIVLTGQPKTANAFQPFTLTYTMRIDRENASSMQTNGTREFLKYWPFIITTALIIIFTAAYIHARSHRKEVNI